MSQSDNMDLSPDEMRELIDAEDAKLHRFGMKGRRGPSHHNSQKTHCTKGHEYTEENTRIDRGARRCRVCERLKSYKKPVSYRRGPYKSRSVSEHLEDENERTIVEHRKLPQLSAEDGGNQA